MKDLYIDEIAKIKAYEKLGRPLFMPEELVFLDFERSIDMEWIQRAFEMYSKDCQNLWLKIKPDEKLNDLDKYIKGYVLKLNSLPQKNYEYQFVEIQFNADNINDYLNLSKSLLPNCEVLFLNPTQTKFEHLEKVQELMTYLISEGFVIDFVHNHENYYQWDAKTLNTSRGPRQVDIDLSNGCTHNCQFCGLYADSVIERHTSQNSGTIPPDLIVFQNAKIEEEKAFSFIEQLPHALERVTLGGAGDPYTHGKINQLIKELRMKGSTVEIFTNFAYLSKKDIETLHDLCLDDKESLSFIINLSGATAETYVKTRPNQTAETFEKVTSAIRYASDLIKRDGKGLYMTLMCVTTKDNYQEMPNLISMSKSLGCERVWIKPLEPHDEENFKILVNDESSLDYAIKAKQSLYLADKLGVEIVEREILERIVENFKEKLSEFEKQTSMSLQIKVLSSNCPWTLECLTTPEVKPIISYRVICGDIFESAPENMSPYEISDWKLLLNQDEWKEEIKKSSETFSSDAHFSNDVFDSQPCYIGHQYMRIHVNGSTTPCCNLRFEIGNANQYSLQEIWKGSKMNSFREKMLELNKEKFHRTDELYSICAKCPHLKFNRLFHQLKTRNS